MDDGLPMMTMARDRTYGGLLPALRGRRVLIWTCGTCARLCDGLGGKDAAADLAARLSADGIDVVGEAHSSACCLMPKALSMRDSAPEGCDLVLALCCDNGARNAGTATGMEVLNPVRTFGPGLQDAEGRPRVSVYRDGRIAGDVPLEQAAEEAGCLVGPFRLPLLYARV